MKLISEDKITKFIKDVVFDETDVDIKKYAMENKEYRLNYDLEKSFAFNTEVIVKEDWMENAGKNYLVTIGKVLGKQTNLYQETERPYPITFLTQRNIFMPLN